MKTGTASKNFGGKRLQLFILEHVTDNTDNEQLYRQFLAEVTWHRDLSLTAPIYWQLRDGELSHRGGSSSCSAEPLDVLSCSSRFQRQSSFNSSPTSPFTASPYFSIGLRLSQRREGWIGEERGRYG